MLLYEYLRRGPTHNHLRLMWYSDSRNNVPRVVQWYGTIAAHIRRRASVIVVLEVFCMHMYSFAGLIRRTIPDFKPQPGNRSRLNRVYRFIMELVNFSPLLFKLFMISLLCKRLLILHYLTNVHIYFVFIFVHDFLVLFSLN